MVSPFVVNCGDIVAQAGVLRKVEGGMDYRATLFLAIVRFSYVVKVRVLTSAIIQMHAQRSERWGVILALVRCPECGREISDQAIACPSCGFPISKHVAVPLEKPSQQKNCICVFSLQEL